MVSWERDAIRSRYNYGMSKREMHDTTLPHAGIMYDILAETIIIHPHLELIYNWYLSVRHLLGIPPLERDNRDGLVRGESSEPRT